MSRQVIGHIGICSFTSTTQVTTDHGKQQISKLHVGDKVPAYNPKTHKMEVQSIMHVWIHSDNDLIDVTITTINHSSIHKIQIGKGEVIHTTSEHPFFTQEHGFTPAGQLRVGMHVLSADGNVGVVSRWMIVHSTKVMYNLEVAQDHTFVVGDGQWVVHNACGITNDGHYYGSYSELDKIRPLDTGYEIHHIIQDAMARDLSGYGYRDAPAVLLFGSVAQEDTEHWATREIQKGATSLFRAQGLTSISYEQARAVGQIGLEFAGLNSTSVDQLMRFTDDYYRGNWGSRIDLVGILWSELDELRVPDR